MKPTRVPAIDQLIRRALIRRIATNLTTGVVSNQKDQ
jgi:hypothetical protein